MILRTGEEKAIIDFHVDYPSPFIPVLKFGPPDSGIYYWDLPTIFPLFYQLDMVLG